MAEKRKSTIKSISNFKVITCGYSTEGFPRNDTLWEALSQLGLKELIDLRDNVVLTSEQIDIINAQKNLPILKKIGRKIVSLYHLYRKANTIIRLTRQKKVDVIFVFHGNFFLAIYLGMLKRFHGASVYFDLYCAAYSTKRTDNPRGFEVLETNILTFFSGKFAERLACLTEEYGDYYRRKYKMSAEKLVVIPDGIQNIWFTQPVDVSKKSHRRTRVLYWGIFIAQHGLDLILDAAEALKNEGIEFVFCGKGEGESRAKEEVHRRNLHNVTFKGFIPTTEELIRVVDSADITFGHLIDIHDVRLSAAIKQLQGMARSKPVIALWTKQKEELYETENNSLPSLVQVEPGAEALTETIRNLMQNPEKAELIGVNARKTVEMIHGIKAITDALKESFAGI
jgi:glycosyltransferase involved in cell wall biosynthesis